MPDTMQARSKFVEHLILTLARAGIQVATMSTQESALLAAWGGQQYFLVIQNPNGGSQG